MVSIWTDENWTEKRRIRNLWTLAQTPKISRMVSKCSVHFLTETKIIHRNRPIWLFNLTNERSERQERPLWISGLISRIITGQNRLLKGNELRTDNLRVKLGSFLATSKIVFGHFCLCFRLAAQSDVYISSFQYKSEHFS